MEYKVFHNKYIRNEIMYQLKTMRIQFKYIDQYHLKNRIQFSRIRSLGWYLKRNQFTLLKDRLQTIGGNQDSVNVGGGDDDSFLIKASCIKMLMKSCVDEELIKLLYEKKQQQMDNLDLIFYAISYYNITALNVFTHQFQIKANFQVMDWVMEKNLPTLKMVQYLYENHRYTFNLDKIIESLNIAQSRKILDISIYKYLIIEKEIFKNKSEPFITLLNLPMFKDDELFLYCIERKWFHFNIDHLNTVLKGHRLGCESFKTQPIWMKYFFDDNYNKHQLYYINKSNYYNGTKSEFHPNINERIMYNLISNDSLQYQDIELIITKYGTTSTLKQSLVNQIITIIKLNFNPTTQFLEDGNNLPFIYLKLLINYQIYKDESKWVHSKFFIGVRYLSFDQLLEIIELCKQINLKECLEGILFELNINECKFLDSFSNVLQLVEIFGKYPECSILFRNCKKNIYSNLNSLKTFVDISNRKENTCIDFFNGNEYHIPDSNFFKFSDYVSLKDDEFILSILEILLQFQVIKSNLDFYSISNLLESIVKSIKSNENIIKSINLIKNLFNNNHDWLNCVYHHLWDNIKLFGCLIVDDSVLIGYIKVISNYFNGSYNLSEPNIPFKTIESFKYLMKINNSLVINEIQQLGKSDILKFAIEWESISFFRFFIETNSFLNYEGLPIDSSSIFKELLLKVQNNIEIKDHEIMELINSFTPSLNKKQKTNSTHDEIIQDYNHVSINTAITTTTMTSNIKGLNLPNVNQELVDKFIKNKDVFQFIKMGEFKIAIDLHYQIINENKQIDGINHFVNFEFKKLKSILKYQDFQTVVAILKIVDKRTPYYSNQIIKKLLQFGRIDIFNYYLSISPLTFNYDNIDNIPIAFLLKPVHDEFFYSFLTRKDFKMFKFTLEIYLHHHKTIKQHSKQHLNNLINQLYKLSSQFDDNSIKYKYKCTQISNYLLKTYPKYINVGIPVERGQYYDVIEEDYNYNYDYQRTDYNENNIYFNDKRGKGEYIESYRYGLDGDADINN